MSNLIKRTLSALILTPLVIFSIVSGSLVFSLFILILMLISFYEWHNLSKTKSYEIFGYFFLLFSFYTFYSLNIHFGQNYNYIFLVISICVLTDIGGFFFGKIFKGPKLSKISPNKTFSGVFGSFFSSITFIIFFNSYFYNIIGIETLNMIILIVIISTTSQLGDLIISYFKRLSNLKDTGNIIPGHGGLLDRIDGMIFAFPISYSILKFNIIF